MTVRVLSSYCLQAVPRRKACLLLNHIYEETHPLVPGTPQPHPRSEDVESSQDSEDHQDHQCVEESLREESEAEDDVACSQEDETLHTRLAQFVKQCRSLHQTVLLHEPLWLKELYAQVKQAGIKCGLNQLQVSPASPGLLQ